ncbi:MAG: peroxidase, partial [Chloroflexi bacterium]|nr:peroxidase [Chloroflexota bacterium]
MSFLAGVLFWFLRLPTKIVAWHRLPGGLLGGLAVGGLRHVLREENLVDTEKLTPADPTPDPDDNSSRTYDGSYNDLTYPTMGQAKTRRFARNVPLRYAYPEDEPAILQPSPRTVSLELMTRHEFQPASSLNLIAAAWIQFQVHDWFGHTTTDAGPWELELPDDDPWHEHPMRVDRTAVDPIWSPDEGIPPAYINTSAHWWAGSQIYGSTDERSKQLRSWEDGKLIIGEDGLLPVDPTTGVDITGFSENWWMGLSLLHTLFTLEHNAICDGLKREYPSWNDERLFHHARLINAALIAKIHSIEWTPGILAHPAVQVGMGANWWGLFGRWVRTNVGRIGSSEILSGIPGSRADHHSGIYAMTEEFTSVYRLHPLIPDEFSIRSRSDDTEIMRPALTDVVFGNSRKRLNEMFEKGMSMEDAV